MKTKMFTKKLIIIYLCVLIFHDVLSQVNSTKVYWVGHSLISNTDSFSPGTTNLIQLMSSCATSQGKTYNYHKHTTPGAPIGWNWGANSTAWNDIEPLIHPLINASHSEYGTFDVMVVTEGVSLQSSYDWWNSAFYARNFYNAAKAANPNARLFLYESWHHFNASDDTFRSYYGPQATFNWKNYMIQMRTLWETILDEAKNPISPPADYTYQGTSVATTDPGLGNDVLDINIIPTGSVLVKVFDRLDANLPTDDWSYKGGTLTKNDFFTNPLANFPADLTTPIHTESPIDDIHPSNVLVYLNAIVHYAVIYQDNPINLPAINDVPSNIATIFKEVAWEVIKNDARTGVSTIWTGSTSNDWHTATNWTNGIPTSNVSAVIKANPVNQPVLNAIAETLDLDIETGANLTINNGSITVKGNFKNEATTPVVINHGSSLFVDGTATGIISYKVEVNNTNWHLISSPVEGEIYGDISGETWVVTNDIANGVSDSSNRAIGMYTNATGSQGSWNYYKTGTANQTFDSGKGYALKRNTAGTYTFTGTYKNSTSNIDITANAIGTPTNENRWNLIGNPYPGYLSVVDFLDAVSNQTALTDSHEAVYVWNGLNYEALTSGHIYPGQAFFVNANIANTSVSINSSMQSHQTGAIFYRASHPTIIVLASNGNQTKSTEINFIEGKTKGLDPRYDIGTFNGEYSSFSIYTHLINENNGIAFMKQALPTGQYDETIVPIGVKALQGKKIKFTVNLENFPEDVAVYLEDRVTNTFTLLSQDNANYSIQLSKKEEGVGRFFLHTKLTGLSNNKYYNAPISIHKFDNNRISIKGLSNNKNKFSLLNILGQKIVETSLNNISNNVVVYLPDLNTGVYVVRVQNEKGSTSKKIIIN